MKKLESSLKNMLLVLTGVCFPANDAATSAETLNVFFDFALPVDALKLPSVAIVELSIQMICGGVS